MEGCIIEPKQRGVDEMDRKKEMIQEGFLEGLASREKTALWAIAGAVAVFLLYFIVPLPVFGVMFVVVGFLAELPQLHLMRNGEYQGLEKKDKRDFIKGYSYVIMYSNMAVYVGLTVVFFVVMWMLGKV